MAILKKTTAVANSAAKAVVKKIAKPNNFDKKAYIKDAGKLYSTSKSLDSFDKSMQGSSKSLSKNTLQKRQVMADSVIKINTRLAKPLENYKKKK